MKETTIAIGAMFGLDETSSIRTSQDAMATTSREIARELPQILRLEDFMNLLETAGISLPAPSLTGLVDIDRPILISLALDPQRCSLPIWMTDFLLPDECHRSLYLRIINAGRVSHGDGVREISISLSNIDPQQTLEYEAGHSIDFTYLCRYADTSTPAIANGELRDVAIDYLVENDGLFFDRSLSLSFGSRSTWGRANLIDSTRNEPPTDYQISEDIKLTRSNGADDTTTTLRLRTQGPVTPLGQTPDTDAELIVVHLDHQSSRESTEGNENIKIILTTLPFDSSISADILSDRDSLARWLLENRSESKFSLRRAVADSKKETNEVPLSSLDDAYIYADFIISALNLLPPTKAPLFSTTALAQ